MKVEGILVSGCPRSGTSLAMHIVRTVYGEDAIYGKEFPMMRELKCWEEQQELETDEQFVYRQFLQRLKPIQDVRHKLEKSMDLNPNGFWECPFTMQGLRYLPRFSDAVSELMEFEKPPILKVVSQALANSDPDNVSKVIFMLRHPRAVAKSQERLDRKMRFRKPGETEDFDLFEEEVVHTPKMFISVTVAAMMWMKKNPHIPVHTVLFDELLDEPDRVLAGVFDFIGRDGDFDTGFSVIDKGLRRSKPDKTKKSNLWADAELVYNAARDMNFDAIEAFARNPRKWTHRESRTWTCARTGLAASEGICLACKSLSPKLLNSFLEKVEKAKIPWKELPCAFDVAYNLDAPLVSIEESVKNNHWVRYVDRRTTEVAND